MPEFVLHIKDGQIKNTSAVKKFFNELTDGKHLVKISSLRKRTLPMNSYLHGVLIPEFKNALVSVGYDEVKTNEQAKLILKAMFLKRQEVNKVTGEVIEYIQDTHNLTTAEMSELFDEVIKFCAEHMNYQIGYPNEQLTMNYE